MSSEVVIEDNIVRSTIEVEIPNVSLSELVFESFDKCRDKELIVDDDSSRRWTGSQFKEMVTNISLNFINVVGVERGDAICIFAPNSDYQAMAIVSLAAIGAIYTGCFHTHPYRELHQTVVNSMASYLVCNSTNVEIAKQVVQNTKQIKKLIVMNMRDDVALKRLNAISFEALLSKPEANHCLTLPRVNPTETATLLFSSGSTGTPKGVIQTHGNYVGAVISSCHSGFEFSTPTDTTSVHQPMCHLGGYLMFIMAVHCECKVIILPSFEVKKFLPLVAKYKITSAMIVPSHLIEMNQVLEKEAHDLTSLTFIGSGGSSMPPSALDQIKKHIKLRRFVAGYGSTEAGFISSHSSSIDIDAASVGIPAPGIQIKICPSDSDVALGPKEVGEIRLKSKRTTPGYFNNAEATKALYDSQGFMKTGDAGYYNEKGHLFIVDRYKDVIKCRTQQVAAVELESLLIQHEAVQEVAIVGAPHPVDGEVPAAFIVKKSGHEVNKETLIDFLDCQVADWKRLRGGVHFIDHMPKTDLGKLKKSALREMLSKLTPKLT